MVQIRSIDVLTSMGYANNLIQDEPEHLPATDKTKKKIKRVSSKKIYLKSPSPQ